MAHHPVLGRIALPALLLALFAFPAPLRADFVPPTTIGAVLQDFTAFSADFTSWNASLNGAPVSLLESTAPADRVGEVLLLFVLWMDEQPGSGSWGTNPFSAGGLESLLGNLGLLGTILSGIDNPGGSNPSSSNPGPDDGGIPTLPLISGSPTGPEPLCGPSSGPGPDSGPGPEVDPTPEPASLVLLGTGALGFMLFGRKSVRERARRASIKEAAL